jgi:aldehyde:ferredoxin oxidoreductase
MAMGYQGKILHVHLTESRTWTEEPGELFYRTYLGGPGIGVYYLLKEMQAGTDPLGPGNILTFAAGILTGTTGPAVCRFAVCARSPLTGAVGKSEAGGWWGPELKRAGWDAVVIRGRAAGPVYLWIENNQVEIRPAGHLWGKTTGEVQQLIRQELGPFDSAQDKFANIRVAQIGPAGENMVRFANIANELAHFNGRNGLGAVMGSKNLRAIAVRGTRKVEVADSTAVAETTRWVASNMKDHPQAWGLHDVGTPGGIAAVNSSGALPTNNWTTGYFAGAERISGKAMSETILTDRGGCFACPIRCKRVVKVHNERFDVDPKYGGPEYETLGAFGSNLGLDDLELVAKANEVCNALGLDTISAGMTISFAMDCFERGLIGKTDTGGLDLRFGNADVLLPLLEAIARRQGFGALLAEGSVRAAEVIGKNSAGLLRHAKGQEVPMHDPRVKTGLGLQYALSSHGADHWIAQHDPLYAQAGSPGLKGLGPIGIREPVPALDLGPEKVRSFYYTHLLTCAYDLLGMCVFGAVARSILPIERLVNLVNATTGWGLDLWELMKAGERLSNMMRLFNQREGLTREADAMPDLFYTPFQGGPLDGKGAIDRARFARALELYYDMAGWTGPGASPSAGKLAELGLTWAAMRA